MTKKGDTLIEVTLAVGIFSMVAISVVAVMNGGTSSAQTALETTLTRDEIDAEAEALRFIHTSYLAEKDSANQQYQKLWENITNIAVDGGNLTEDLLQFSPTNCSELYDSNGEVMKHGFVINYRQLGNFSNSSSSTSPFIKASQATFIPASTYPRLVYVNNGIDENETALNTALSGLSTFYQAEGIYVIAVKDQKTTNIVSEGKKVSAFYDFYIRTCWYGTDANEPSTISTVIRLYDPKAVE